MKVGTMTTQVPHFDSCLIRTGNEDKKTVKTKVKMPYVKNIFTYKNENLPKHRFLTQFSQQYLARNNTTHFLLFLLLEGEYNHYSNFTSH